MVVQQLVRAKKRPFPLFRHGLVVLQCPFYVFGPPERECVSMHRASQFHVCPREGSGSNLHLRLLE